LELSPRSPTNTRIPWTLGLAAVVWVLPLWVIRFLPMLDYPQQLAMAAILRWYHDPVRRFAETFDLALWRPQGLFEMVTAGLAWVVSIETAGKLVIALSLAGVLPAALALCRRTGRPDWYALLALAVTYNHAFYWGFADNLPAYPLVLAGMALADRLFDRPLRPSGWLLLAGYVLLFYTVHLEFLLVLAGGIGWLALVRRSALRELAVRLSTVVPGLALGAGVLGWAHLHQAEVMTAYQRHLQTEATRWSSFTDKLATVPDKLFGAYSNGTQWLLIILLLAAVCILVPDSSPRDGEERGGLLFRSRFGVAAAVLFVLSFILPEFTRGYMVAERLVAMAAMLAVPALPCPRSAPQRRLAGLLIGLLLVVQLGQTVASFLRFSAETAGLSELLASTEPGQSLAGLIYERSDEWEIPHVLAHYEAYYQVLRGGRTHFTFVQFFNSPVRFRPGQNWPDPIAVEWDEWNPWDFRYRQHGGPFRYFLLYGSRIHLMAAFGRHLGEVRVRQAGHWFLIERQTRPPADTPGAVRFSPG
jgi:hypothetical protein